MNRKACWGRLGRRPVVCALVALAVCLPQVVRAQQQPEDDEQLPEWEWPAEVEGPLRTFFEREDVEAVLTGVVAPARAATASLAALANVVGNGLDEPFRWVQRRIRFESYAGSIRGARGALRSGGGNALDQALLLRDLYRVAGHTARLARGRLGWDLAVQLAGERRDELPGRGDPWLRQVEAASDHWWVEVRDGGAWLAADPSFSTTALGESVARRRSTAEEPPDRLVAMAQLEILVGGRSLGGIQVPVAQIFGTGVHVAPARPTESLAGSDAPEAGPGAAEADASEQAAANAPQLVYTAPPDSLDPAPVLEAIPEIPEGPVTLELLVGGRRVATAPVPQEQLGDVRLAIDIDLPPGRHIRQQVPFGDSAHDRLVVVVAGGELRRDTFAAPLGDLYVMFTSLVRSEQAALEAWRLRPREDEADGEAGVEGRAEPRRAPPVPRLAPAPRPGDEPEVPVHPAIELHAEAVRAWQTFARSGAETVALALLAAADQLPAAVPVDRAELRLVALQYRPGASDVAGGLTAWITDPARVTASSGQARMGRQLALGLLQSALAGQVLNRVADAAPITAFDLTLRAVGSGSRLQWFGGDTGAPGWPAGSRAVARQDLASGRMVIGPGQPIRSGDEELLAWWAISSGSGMTTGRVQRSQGVAQAAVEFGGSVEWRSLDAVLASLHDLHEATRWLLSLGDPDRATLRDLVPGACAATPLVAELLRAGAPDDFIAPAFADFCRPLS